MLLLLLLLLLLGWCLPHELHPCCTPLCLVLLPQACQQHCVWVYVAVGCCEQLCCGVEG
jgi:hypothetical protein